MQAAPPVPIQHPASAVELQAASGIQLLHHAFSSFNGAVNGEPCWEMSRSKMQHLHTEWQSKGLFGAQALKLVEQHRFQVAWESMVPEQFNRFYRFLFHICRDPGRRNLQTDVAVASWRLLLRGRFRLLDRWCDFVLRSRCQVVTEDTWRQVLDFSRTVHEDLSNYDPSAAWAVLLDEFVDHVRCLHPLSRRVSVDQDLDAAAFVDCSWSGGMLPVAPSCGSKRRCVDVDCVADQLHNMPLLNCDDAPCGGDSISPKRVCTTPTAPPSHLHHQQPQLAGSTGGAVTGVHSSQRRVVRTRRSGMSDMLRATVTDALGFAE